MTRRSPNARPSAPTTAGLALATTTPPWLRSFAPSTKKEKREPEGIALVGEVYPILYRAGFPHLRFAADDDATSPEQVATAIFMGGEEVPRPLVRPRSVWTRFVRAYAGSVTTLSSNPRSRTLTKEAKAAIANDAPFEASEVGPLVRALLGRPGSLRQRRFTEDFVFGLEAMFGPEIVSDAIVQVFESPPPGTKALDARLGALKESKRYPVPVGQLATFLRPASVKKGAFVPDVGFAKREVVLAAMTAFRPEDSPLELLDPRLVYLGGSAAVPIYLSKWRGYERSTHPNVAERMLGWYVDAIGPFRDPKVTDWLASMEGHALVGATAKAWRALHG